MNLSRDVRYICEAIYVISFCYSIRAWMDGCADVGLAYAKTCVDFGGALKPQMCS